MVGEVTSTRGLITYHARFVSLCFSFGIGVTESARLGNVSKPSRDVLLSYVKQKCHKFHVNKP